MAVERMIDITPLQRDIILSLLKTHLPDTTVWVYGSRVKRNARSNSDLDMVVFSTPEQSSQVYELRDAFDESDLPFRVDLFVWDEVPEQFHKNIEAEHVVLLSGKRQNIEGWVETKLQEIVTVLGDGLHGTPKYTDDGEYYFINGNNLDNGRIVFKDNTRKVSEEEFLKYKKNLNDKTLLVSINGTLGNTAYYNDEKVILGKSACYFNLTKSIDRRFVRYIMTGQHFQNYINSYATGTTIKNVSLKLMREFSFQLPPLPEQKAIAHILGSLDDKIELNRKMNATLEGMAQALFKSWFVDFDPVIDNAIATGNPMPKELAERAEVRRKALADGTANRETAKQFPAAFQLTEELGWIPEGWEVKELGSIAQNVRTPADPTTLPEYTLYVGLEHIDRHAFSLTRWGYSPDVDSQKSRFESSDFLFGKLRPYFHKVCQVQTGGICSTDILVIRPKENTYSGFVGCQIFEPEFVEHANLRSTGTRMPRASWKNMAKYEIALPAFQLIETFNNIVQPTREKCKRTVEESLTLTNLRDTLLPKLISGELRIPDTEQGLGER